MSEVHTTKSIHGDPIDHTREPVQCEGSPDVFIYPRVSTSEVEQTRGGLPMGHIAFVAVETFREPSPADEQ